MVFELAQALPPRFAAGNDFEFAPRAGKTEHEGEISLRHIAEGIFGPLDQAHGIATEILAQPRIFKLFRMVETIKIKVIPVYARNYVNFNQCVGRALHRTPVAQCAQKRPGQRGLACAEVAIKPDHHAGRQQGRELPAKRNGCGLVGQQQGEGRRGCCELVMIRAMQAKNSETGADDKSAIDFAALAEKIRHWGLELGFAGIGIAGAEVSAATPEFMRWLALGRHGEMDYMAKHAPLRTKPQALVPGTLSVITARLPYWPEAADGAQVLANPELAHVSRYALGRDYHKTIRSRLQKLADRIHAELSPLGAADGFAYRAFSDSAPVMEVEFARQSGIAWRGKHTLSLTREGSWHFLGEIYTTLPLPPDAPQAAHCGDCRHCIDACPTAAIVAPYEVDARRCISYLTIELHGAIPVELRPLIGNRIYGCDDCQLCCPWNRFAQIGDPDFAVRNGLDCATLAELFAWSEEEFNRRLAGSPIRRIGHERWLRNIAVALGTATEAPASAAALASRANHPSELVREHVRWALSRHENNAGNS